MHTSISFQKNAPFILILFFIFTSNALLFSQDNQSSSEKPAWTFVRGTASPTLPFLQNNPELTVVHSAYINPASFETAERVVLGLFEGKSLGCRFLRNEHHPCGTNTWVGRLEGQKWGYFILSDTEGVKWGKIETDDGDIFMICPAPGREDYALVQIANAGMDEKNCAAIEEDSPSHPEEGEKTERALTSICDAEAICNPRTLDLLVLYSPTARSSMGGSAAAQSAIATAVSEMNLINTNSQVVHHFALAHAAEVSYSESGSFSADLDRLEDPNDGFMDEIFNLRDQYYADLISLVLTSGGCGLGNFNAGSTFISSNRAFSVVSVSCLATNKSLAHESGHNLGLAHDRFVHTGSTSCDWAYGFVNPNANGGTTSQRWRTVMAYNNQCVSWGFNCSRIPHWSNPDITFNGDPTGIDIGLAGEANSTYLLNRSICLVDGFRTPPPCSDCTVFQSCEPYNLQTSNGPGNTTAIQLTDNFPAAEPGDSIQICIDTRGDHSSSTEIFNILDESGGQIGQTLVSTDCGVPARICFEVSPATYNSWVADGAVTITLDPIGFSINPTLCINNGNNNSGIDRACIELLYKPAPHDLTLVEGYEFGGGSGDFVYDLFIDVDGSKYIVGETFSTDGDFSGVQNYNDGFIMKVTPSGTIDWIKTIGGNSNEQFFSIIKAGDGYLYAGGTTRSNNNGDIGVTYGGYEALLVKISTSGLVEWIQTYGSPNTEKIHGIHEAANGDIALIAETNSSGNSGDIPPTGAGPGTFPKLWFFTIKKSNGEIDASSSVNKVHFYDVNNTTSAFYVTASDKASSGYIVTGYCNINGTSGCAPTSSSQYLMLFVKLDDNGDLVWSKYYGGSVGVQAGIDVNANADGTFTAVGNSTNASNDCDVQSPSLGFRDIYVVKVDASGNLLWGKLYGGSSDEDAYSLVELPNQNYLMAAQSNSTNMGVSNNGLSDVYILEIDKNGNFSNNHDLFGGSSNDVRSTTGTLQSPSGCYIALDNNHKAWFVTSAQSNDGDVPGTVNFNTSHDIWIAGLGSGGSCPPDAILNDDPIVSNMYQAANTIESAGVIYPASSVVFTAGQSITLKPDFWSKQNSEFHAYLGSCAAAMPRSGEVAAPDPAPLMTVEEEARLHCYPNPFYSEATIEYELPAEQRINLFVADISGRICRRVVTGEVQAEGIHHFTLTNEGLRPGLYFVILQVESGEEVVGKLVVL